MVDLPTINPRMPLIDIKSGLPTRDLFRLLQALQDAATDFASLLIINSVTNGVNDQAPSSNAVFDALADLSADVAADIAALQTSLGSYLLSTDAAATYLTISGAAATYIDAATVAAGYQPLDADLTSWSAIARASGFDTFATTPSSANLAALLADETGTGAAVFAGSPALTGSPTAPTQSPSDNSTKIATTAYADAAVAAGGGGGGTSMTLLGTLTTTSGTTQSLTGIAAGYLKLYCEFDGVSFTASATISAALGSGATPTYGTARAVSTSSASAGGAIWGFLIIGRIGQTDAFQPAFSVTDVSIGSASVEKLPMLNTGTAAVVNAIQFSGGTFDAGTIRIYGVK